MPHMTKIAFTAYGPSCTTTTYKFVRTMYVLVQLLSSENEFAEAIARTSYSFRAELVWKEGRGGRHRPAGTDCGGRADGRASRERARATGREGKGEGEREREEGCFVSCSDRAVAAGAPPPPHPRDPRRCGNYKCTMTSEWIDMPARWRRIGGGREGRRVFEKWGGREGRERGRTWTDGVCGR